VIFLKILTFLEFLNLWFWIKGQVEFLTSEKCISYKCSDGRDKLFLKIVMSQKLLYLSCPSM